MHAHAYVCKSHLYKLEILNEYLIYIDGGLIINNKYIVVLPFFSFFLENYSSSNSVEKSVKFPSMVILFELKDGTFLKRKLKKKKNSFCFALS